MPVLFRRVLAASVFVVACAGSQAWAQSPVRVRGTIENVDGTTYMVKDRAGAEHKVVLADKAALVALVRSSIADIKPGMFVGCTAVPEADGGLRAVEVHIFPEAMRGVGEGHRPWDLKPNSTMTNANVESSVASNDGQTLTMKYKDGEKKITVTPDTVVVTYAPGDAKEVTRGVQIFIPAAEKQPDGSLKTARINYGRNGLAPPM